MRDSRTDTRRDMRSLAVAGGVILAMAIICGSIVAFAYYRMYRSTADTSGRAKGRIVGQDDRPSISPPAAHGYVGSAACAECHGDIAEAYESHPMAHSLAEVTKVTVVEDYENATFAPTGGRIYEVERRDDEVLHHEKLFDADGKLLYDQAEPIKFEIGSGRRGRAYVIDRGGLLFQSPIAWYSLGQKWELSPGYAPVHHQRFSRRIGDGCLYCHAGRVATDRPQSDRYRTPPFIEASIGCERCHGPGEKHVARQTNNPTSGEPDPTIVNPARLDPIHRDSVCYQCHLQGQAVVPRSGKNFFDFRPGQRLDDVWVVFVAGNRTDEEGHAKAVSQVEQMRSSRCFVASDGQLGCISCHDPHSLPSVANKVEFFNKKCLVCHEDHGCSLPMPQQFAAPANGSCIACHMPPTNSSNVAHTALTDHRILRKPDEALPTSIEDDESNSLQAFDNAEQRLPPAEWKRAQGLALPHLGLPETSRETAIQVEALLVPDSVSDPSDIGAVLDAVGNDEQVLYALGTSYLCQQRLDHAIACWQRILQFNPTNEFALERLMVVFHTEQDLSLAMAYANQLLAVNPYDSVCYGRRSHMFGLVGSQGHLDAVEDAIQSALKSTEYDPTIMETQEWLVEMYRAAGKPEEAQTQQQFVDRLKAALIRQ